LKARRKPKPKPSVKESPQIAERLRRTLVLFPALPDDALVDVRVVAKLLGRSVASVWRDSAQGRLARPIHIGIQSTRWKVADVRAALTSAS
jgi:predicted DNA-binding transcriptional regulator AlpA